MDIETIVEELNKRFDEPLAEFYQRRIIFWLDPDKQFEDSIDGLSINNAQVIRLKEDNNFEIKKLLSFDDLENNYLLYTTSNTEGTNHNWLEDFWLADIYLYSEEFRADMITILMDELRVPSGHIYRKMMKEYYNFFKAKVRKEKFSSYGPITTPNDVVFNILASLSQADTRKETDVFRKVFEDGWEESTNQAYQNLDKYGALTHFWQLVEHYTGYRAETPSLENFIYHVILTASSRTINEEALLGLDDFISYPHQGYCYNLVHEWLTLEDNDFIVELARITEEIFRIEERLLKIEIEDYWNTEIFPSVDTCILSQLFRDIQNEIIDVERINQIVEKRRVAALYMRYESYYNALFYIGKMKEFSTQHHEAFHYTNAKTLWSDYTENLFMMDSYYRKFQLNYRQTLKNRIPEVHELFIDIAENQIENLYKNWYLDSLSANWTKLIEDDYKIYGYVQDVPKQSDFYKRRIENTNNRVFVIISDAFRYEVAYELAENLKKLSQTKVRLDSMQALFPTATKYGMAALLPHNKFEIVENKGEVSVLIDGQSTKSNNRQVILQSKNENSLTLKYHDFMESKREDRRSILKGKEVVYIYHDSIDSASHSDETKVFEACELAVEEIQSLIRLLTHDHSASDILVTSDHGFTYTAKPLEEADMLSKTDIKDQAIELKRRYVIAHKASSADFLMEIKLYGDNEKLIGYTPRQNLRLQTGGQSKFVHGGVSLQELVVPLLEFRYLRNDSLELKRNANKYRVKPVEVQLLSNYRKISNLIFKLDFYQVDAVEGNREAATYKVWFQDADKKRISDEHIIIADKVDENEKHRTFQVTFNLFNQEYSPEENYYLILEDQSKENLPEKYTFTIDIPFVLGDFDFFA